MRVSRKEPGLIVSAAAHATLLAAAFVAFSSTAKFDDAQEAVPIEMISDSAFSQITKGEKTAKDVKPVQKADKIAEKQEVKPTPPLNEAKKDTPLPPPDLRRQADPGDDDEKKPEPQKMAALPPPRPAEETRPAPTPPERPQPAKPQAKEEPKPDPADAEPVAPKPPPRPKLETKTESKPEPKAEAKTEPKTESKPEPKPAPKPPEKARLDRDAIAKLLATDKSSDRPGARPKSGEPNDQAKSKFSANDISRLLDHDKPQSTGSTGREVIRTASLGTATGAATRMSPSMMDALNSWMIEQYTRCWHYFGTGAGQKYIPLVKVRFRSDGALAAEPLLVNPTADPALQSLATAAINATRECNPLRVPSQFASYYEQWKSRTIAFDPEVMR
ncbi:MAG: cell envelope biogenesis protein TolA [Hyphomicrobiales bacterium]|nr:cell envelope biogenesis protein TolA [Hyphomicrobiales bacterium]